MENLQIFIDGEYVLQSLRTLKNRPKNLAITKYNLHWAKLIDFIANGRNVSKVYYYTARLDKTENADTYNEQTEYLKTTEESLSAYNVQMRLGKMIKTRIKSQSTWNDDRKKNKSDRNKTFSWVQKGIDTKIVLDLCGFAYTADSSNNNAAILIVGDEDFAETLKTVGSLKIKTELVAFKRDSRVSQNLIDSVTTATAFDYTQLHQLDII